MTSEDQSIRPMGRLSESLLRLGSKISKALTLPGHRHRKTVPNGHRESIHAVHYDSAKPTEKLVYGFDVVPMLPFDQQPLKPAQLAKAQHLLASWKGKDLEALEHLLEVGQRPGSTRNDLIRRDWNVLDQVNFLLTQEHLEHLCELFNDPISAVNQAGQEFTGFDLKEALIAEALAKGLAYIAGRDGTELAVPALQASGGWRMVSYCIELKVIGDAMPYYVLRARDAEVHPWIVFRGSEVILGSDGHGEFRAGAMESLLTDTLDRDGVGLRAYASSAQEVAQLMNEIDPPYVTGHSLGGYFAQRLALEHPDRVHQVYAFSAPGVSRDEYRRYQEHQEILEHKVVNFDRDGDIVPSAGPELMGTHYAIYPDPARPLPQSDPIHDHIRHDLNKTFQVEKVDIQRERRALSRQISEKVRCQAGRFLKHFALKGSTIPNWAQKGL